METKWKRTLKKMIVPSSKLYWITRMLTNSLLYSNNRRSGSELVDLI